MIVQAIVALLQQAPEIDRATVRSSSFIARPPITSCRVSGGSIFHAAEQSGGPKFYPQYFGRLIGGLLFRGTGSARGRRKISQGWTGGTPRALGAVARCLIIRTAVHQFACIIRAVVTILPGVSVAVRLRLICMLQHNRCGGNHSLFEGGKLGVGHVAEAFGDCIRRKVERQPATSDKHKVLAISNGENERAL
jgi:hypothetical protein